MARVSLIILLALLSCSQQTTVCADGFTPVTVSTTTFCVMQDYYSVNGVRRPLSYPEALAIAEDNNWQLPTPEIVDAIWQQADLRLEPITMRPGSLMSSESYIHKHNELINEQIGNQPFTLIAGHKKDVVLQQRAGRVTIYGWQHLDGSVIQPISSVHSEHYYDYSHGIRFIYELRN